MWTIDVYLAYDGREICRVFDSAQRLIIGETDIRVAAPLVNAHNLADSAEEIAALKARFDEAHAAIVASKERMRRHFQAELATAHQVIEELRTVIEER